jgi:hypothetical protein
MNPGKVMAAVMEPERGIQLRGIHGGLEAGAGTPFWPEAALAWARAADQHVVDALAHRDLSAPAGLRELEPEHTPREVHPIPRQPFDFAAPHAGLQRHRYEIG